MKTPRNRTESHGRYGGKLQPESRYLDAASWLDTVDQTAYICGRTAGGRPAIQAHPPGSDEAAWKRVFAQSCLSAALSWVLLASRFCSIYREEEENG